MLQRTIRSLLTLAALALMFATLVLAQSPASHRPLYDPVDHVWQAAQAAGPSKGKLFVVTFDQPDRRQTCHIQSFTPDKLVCSRVIGSPRTYLPEEVLLLVVPGNEYLKVPWLIGFNSGAGAAIWGTAVLAAACPICAAATGFAAAWCLVEAALGLTDSYRHDRILYSAPPQNRRHKDDFVGRKIP